MSREHSALAQALAGSEPLNQQHLSKHLHHLHQSHHLQLATTSTSQHHLQPAHQQPAAPLLDLVGQLGPQSRQLVRRMIAQHLAEFLVVCVIISYLIFYFCFVSRRPKLVGDPRSRLLQFVRGHLKQTLESRFNPLLYFWGTNPQTALFGYLQGNSSLHEMPRAAFKRQLIFVSDAQYLTSNVDLSRHYAQSKKRHALQLKPDCEHLIVRGSEPHPTQQVTTTRPPPLAAGHQLEQNIRLHMAGVLRGAAEHAASSPASTAPEKRQLFSGSASGSTSSSDSGVFGGEGASSSASSSTSSLAGVAAPSDGASSSSSIQEDSPPLKTTATTTTKPQTTPRCSCKARYKSPAEQLMFPVSAAPLKAGNDEPLLKQQVCREQLEFGQCALDWHRASHQHYHANRLVALISAGMTTGSDKKYVTDTVRTLEQLGYEVCVFIRRGVGGLKLSSSKFFSPAKWRDFEAAVLSIRQQRPGARLVGVGFSFGSIELCRYLSMSGPHSLIDAALLISCPFDPEAGGRNMRKRALNRKIDAYLAVNLGKQLYRSIFGSGGAGAGSAPQELASQQQQQLVNHNGSLVDLRHLPKIKSLVDFEDNFNRVIQHYPSSEAYAADSRLQPHLCHIRTPTLCLSSEDDFMAPLKLLPLREIEQNRNLCMVLTRRGGHMAFIDGLLWPRRPYFAQRIIERFVGALRCHLPAREEPAPRPAEVAAAAPPPPPPKSHHLLQMFTGAASN